MSKQMKKLNKKQSGFTLIEIAIVMGIIGVLLGGVIKGQELIESAKEKRIYSDYKSLQAAVFVYVDRFGKYPGDIDNSNDGLTDAEMKGTADKPGFWASLREAGFVEGQAKTGNDYFVGFQSNVYGGVIEFTTKKNICFSEVPGQASDAYVKTKSGTAYEKGTNGQYGSNKATNIDKDKTYKVCFAA